MRGLLISLLLLLCLSGTKAQIPAIELMGDEPEIKIPFTYYYHFVIVEVMLDGLLPIRLLLDTGAENTLLFERAYTDLIGAKYEREVSIMGSDFSTELTAMISRRVPLTFPGIGDTHSDMIVLMENLYHLEQFIGVDIHGILGANIFNGLVLSIDYRKEHIIISKPEVYQPPKYGYALPITLHNGKPYCKALTQCGSSKRDTLKYLIDTGAGVTTMLHANTHPSIQIPANIISGNLGSGLGGYIKGYIGRMEEFRIGPYGFKNMITSFQELDSSFMAKTEVQRNGIMGNQILSRFDITIDYTTKMLYLVPNKDYYARFEVDRSGLFLIASGKGLDDYYVQDVLPNSPAALAGLESGDEIISVNGWHVSLFSLGWLTRQFQKDPGKRIRLKVRRNGKKMKKTFYLEDLI